MSLNSELANPDDHNAFNPEGTFNQAANIDALNDTFRKLETEVFRPAAPWHELLRQIYPLSFEERLEIGEEPPVGEPKRVTLPYVNGGKVIEALGDIHANALSIRPEDWVCIAYTQDGLLSPVEGATGNPEEDYMPARAAVEVHKPIEGEKSHVVKEFEVAKGVDNEYDVYGTQDERLAGAEEDPDIFGQVLGAAVLRSSLEKTQVTTWEGMENTLPVIEEDHRLEEYLTPEQIDAMQALAKAYRRLV